MADKKRKKKEQGAGISSIFLPAAIGIAATAAVALLIILIGGKLAYGGKDPSSYSTVIGLAAAYISAFAGGLAAALSSGKDLRASVLHAIAITAILLISSVFAGGSAASNIILKSAAPICSLLGGGVCFLAHSKKKKPKFKGRNK